MKHIYGLGMLLCAMSALSPLPARANVTSDVILSEINWAGSTRSTSDEWVELWNRGGADVDVGGWFLTGVGTSDSAIMLADGTVVLAGSTLLISNYARGEEKTTVDVDPNLVSTAVSIPNTALNIVLAMPDGLVIDELHDPGEPDYGSKDIYASMERDPGSLEWRTATTSLGLLDDHYGTPGAVNTSLSLPDTETETVTEEVPIDTAPIEDEPSAEEAIADEIPIENETPTVEEPVAESPTEIPITEPIADPIITEPVVEPITESPSETETATPDEEIEIVETIEIELIPVIETTTEPVDAPKPAYTPDMIRFSEIFSRPSAGDEWIELANMQEETISLTDWYVTDASGKMTSLTGSLAPGGYLLLKNPKGKLNNDGDILTLFAPDGSIVGAVEYGTADLPAPDIDESLIWLEGEWKLTTAQSPTGPNILKYPTIETVTKNYGDPHPITIDEPAHSDQVPSPAKSTPTNAPHDVAAKATDSSNDLVAYVAAPASIKTAATTSSASASKKKSAPAQQAISATRVTGSIVALPGIFGKQVMFINGQEIYFNAADWPALSLNDHVEISGTQSTADGNTRIKIADASGIRVIGTQEVEPLEYSDALAHGTLISLSGTIVAKTSAGFTVETDGGSRIEIAIDRDSGIHSNEIIAGDITVTGILRRKNGNAAIYPRSPDDLTFATAATAQAPSPAPTTSVPWLGVSLILGSSGALGTWYMRARTSRNALTLQNSSI